MRRLLPLLLSVLVLACSPDPGTERAESASVAAVGKAPSEANAGADTIESNPERNAYFGDLHVHTVYPSMPTCSAPGAGPDDAYRFAKGGTLEHAAGFDMKLKAPLDFYAVTDHALVLGTMAAMADTEHPLSRHPDAQSLTDTPTREDRANVFRTMAQFLNPDNNRHHEIHHLPTVRSTWADIVDAANRHNDPGQFTAFIGFEYSSAPDRQNLHRNVIFNGGKAPAAPFSRFDSSDPEDLWAWMDGLRDRGMEALAIPHNSNGLQRSDVQSPGSIGRAAGRRLRQLENAQRAPGRNQPGQGAHPRPTPPFRPTMSGRTSKSCPIWSAPISWGR